MRLARLLLGTGLALVAAGALVLADAWTGLGAQPSGARLERLERSPNYRDGHFVNPQPIVNHVGRTLEGLLEISEDASPRAPVEVAPVEAGRFGVPPESGLRVTWLGHSALLVELDGRRFLTDPQLSERASPLDWVGPRRWYPSPIAVDALPPLDAVIISHDHYDHLDHRTVMALAENTFVVPLGIGAHLEAWGVRPDRIIELDWWEKTKLGEVELVATPARHASGRFLAQDGTLWASYALIGPRHRVYFSGDTGLFPGMREIGERYGPFDLTMIEVGQYHAGWPDWHIGPEQALVAHAWLRGARLLPVHWGSLALAYHGWTEPIERALAAGQAAHVLTPRPGESIEPERVTSPERWWPALAWQSSKDHPIVSSQVQ